MSAGADPSDARTVSEALVWSDHRGRFTQGTIWLEAICGSILRGDVVSPAPMHVDVHRPAAVAIDAAGGLGHVAGLRAVGLAAERAIYNGIAIATVRNSSHFGACGFYANRLAEQGLVGIVATNAYPKVAPHGGRTASLGTNPIGFAAPIDQAPPVIGDLSTGAVAGSMVREARATGRPLDEQTALDGEGRPTPDASALANGGVLLPFGGAKGFALGILVEVLTSGLAAGTPPSRLGSMFAPGRPGTSHVVIAIGGDSGLPERLGDLRESILSASPRGSMEIRLPGDDGHRREAADVIVLPPETDAALERLATRLGRGTP